MKTLEQTLSEKLAEKIRLEIYQFCKDKNLGFYFTVEDFTYRNNKNNPEKIELYIEPHGYKNKPEFDGLQMIYSEKTFEISEYQAGPNKNNLYIYKETKSLKIALKDFLKGNNRKPIKVW